MSYSSCSGVMSKQLIKAGDPIVAFLIVRNKISDHYLNNGKASFRSNEGDKVIYKPISFPIFGNASYWGKMVDIEKTQHIIDIEKNLNMSIEKFIDNIGEFEIDNKLNRISICYEHRYIYENMVKHAKEKENENIKNINFFPVVLKCLGFDIFNKNYEERYCFHYKNPKYPEYIIKSDGLFIEIQLNNKKHPENFNFIDFIKFFKIDIKTLKEKNNFNFLNEQAREYYKILLENNYFKEEIPHDLNSLSNLIDKKNNNKMTKKDEELLENLKGYLQNYLDKNNKNKVKKIFNQNIVERMEHHVNEVRNFISYELYNKEIFEYDDEIILETQYFLQAMYKTNSIWIPTYSCYDECGDKSFSKKLLEITKGVD